MAEVRYRVADSGTFLSVRLTGHRIRTDLLAKSAPGDVVVIDFTDVIAITGGCADELLTPLVAKPQRRRFVIDGMNENVRQVLTLALDRRGLALPEQAGGGND
jgi:regulator of RNase E activity RraA